MRKRKKSVAAPARPHPPASPPRAASQAHSDPAAPDPTASESASSRSQGRALSALDTHTAPRLTPQQVKAFSHPLRMTLYRLITDHGRATASMLARETGESTGQTSYHLRQLERFGFIEDDDDQGSGRERWWKAIGFSFGSKPTDEQPVVAPEAMLVAAHFIDEHADSLRRWAVQSQDEPREWQRATVSSSSSISMTADELAALSSELMQVVERHADAAEARDKAERSQPQAPHLAAADAPAAEHTPADAHAADPTTADTSPADATPADATPALARRRVRIYLDTLVLPQSAS